MLAIGDGPGHKGWTVGIRDPEGIQPYLARVHLFDEAVATSGDYEQFVDKDGKRHGHIIDPRTGWSAHGLSSVTVVTPHAMVADAWATALFVLGPEKARALAKSREDLKVILVEPGDSHRATIWVEEQLKSRFELKEELRDKMLVLYF
jgi:thiamine biosynthesis lipoprotein